MKAQRFWLFIFLCSMLFVSPLVLDARAQGMGTGTHTPLMSPTSGPRGTTVTINFNVTNYLFTHEASGGSLQNSYGTEYRIGWDIGGYPANSGASYETVTGTGWTPIGTARVDRFGNISTTITIPSDAQIGDDHYIYAIPPNYYLEQGAYYWWDFFHVTEGSVPSQPSTPSQPSHPEKCKLDVTWTNEFAIVITPATSGYDTEIGPYHGVYDWKTTVKLNCTHYWPSRLLRGFGGWNITTATSQYMAYERVITITLESDTTVNPIENGCFIATATYGSELSPEVQFLRGFRENVVMSSFTGQQFVAWFNTVYYSFSPAVASSVASSEASSNWMKASLYPMMGILHLGAGAYSMFGFSPDLGIVVFVLLVSFLMSLVYLTPAVLIVLTPLLALKKTSISTKKVKVTALIWVGTILATVVAAVGKIPFLMMASGALLVGSTVSLTILLAVKLLLEHWLWRNRKPSPFNAWVS